MAEDPNPSPSRKSQPLWTRPWFLFLLALVGALCLFFGIIGSRIVHAAAEAPAKKADVIVVFGAAEYAGRPSPVYRARLDHGYELFQKGMAPVVITTGGAARVANIIGTNGMSSCIAVSDAYHVFRIRALLEKEGVVVELAPRPESRPHPLWERFVAVMREAAS